MPKIPDSPVVRRLTALRSKMTKLISAQREAERTAKTGMTITMHAKNAIRDKQWQETAKLAHKILVDDYTPASPAKPEPRGTG